MKIFIPEIGTKFKLTQDWTFTLENERRNLDLLKFINSKPIEKSLTRQAELKSEIKRLQQLADKENSEFKLLHGKHSTTTLPFQHQVWELERESWNNGRYEQAKKYKTQKHTLTKGTVLEVDRIYIRKGASDFSSITFRIKGGKTSPRFWARLDDVNNLECAIDAPEEKWLNGRFTLQRYGGHGVYWVSSDRLPSPGGGIRYSGVGFIDHKYDGSIHNRLEGIFEDRCANNSFGKVNHYDSLEKLVEGAKRLNFPEKLIEAFVKSYNEQVKNK